MTFEGDLKQYVKKVRDMSTRRFRRIGMKALGDVVDRTPVKTGVARANWNVKLNAPEETFSMDKMDTGGGMAIGMGSVVVSGAKLGDTIHLTNTAPYIERLEDGWSKQAGRGFMVALTIKEIQSLIDRDLI